ncbi:MAG TPA: translational GTPase TypA, partial [Phycisphaerales bacterium]|nr:translational GTPase TypA [Phycisphaerales bacterium]
ASANLLRGEIAEQDCVLDSNPLERERGITIFSKNCAIDYRPTGASKHTGETYRINIIDTPGHADFGGEVERVLRMADAALLVVDAFEGPMPQTRFVLTKALELKLRIIVVVNKCDRPEARPSETLNEVFDLLVELGADDATLDFPVVYASGRGRWATMDLAKPTKDMVALLELIVDRVPPPTGDPSAPLQMLITTLDYSDYVGRIAIGRVFNGCIRSNQMVGVCRADGSVTKARVQKLLGFEGLGRKPVEEILAGDLCAVEGVTEFDIGDTVCSLEHPPMPLPRVHVDEPTLHMVFRVNDSPFVGKEGKFVTSRQISERLQKELQYNVALKVEPGDSAEEFKVSGRGLLHLGVLLENMRREGYELSVGRPEVITKMIDGEECEPLERLTVDLKTEEMGPAMELLGSRNAEILNMHARGERMHVEAEIPAKGLIGLKSRMMTATGGEAVMYHSFSRYAPVRGSDRKRINGVMISNDNGTATEYSMLALTERGVMLVRPGDPVYTGMIVGENSRENDMVVNIVRAKQLTNFREANKEATVVMRPPRILTLEGALEYIEPGELVEITPQSIRLRKKLLDENARKRAERSERSKQEAMQN